MATDKRRATDDPDTDDQPPNITVRPRANNKLVDKQRSQIDHLMKNIDRPVDLSAPEKPTLLRPPPEIVLNVRGSSAGAGSSDFSIYRDLRRKENLRIKLMEAEAEKDSAKDQFIDEIEALKRKDDAKTARNRAKRQRRKNKSQTTK
ncbi:PRKR-interacting protein 1 [Coemansia erecta]|nr:PRKR-interacting protein 1 [Coemansia erecta]